MFNISLRGRPRPDDGDSAVNGHAHEERAPLAPWSEREGVREIRHYKVDPRGPRPPDRLPGRLLGVAGVVIFAALIGAAFVAYESQRLFALAHNHKGAAAAADQWRAVIIAGLPDAGWVAMALVALVAALRGQSSLRARVGVLLFFGLSLGAQILYAPPTLEGILVAVIAPVTMAWMLESFIVEVRRWAGSRRGLTMDDSPILTGVLGCVVRVLRGMLGLVMWMIRLLLDRRGTWSGVRDWVLDTAPLAPGRTRASLTAAAALEQASEAAEQVAAIEAAVSSERTEMAERLAEVERMTRETERAQAQAALAELRAELVRARADAETERAERIRQTELAAVPTGRARLIALYEQLRGSDPRYMNQARTAEIAKELYEAAGLKSEGTARNYLYDHIKGSQAAEMSPVGGMIEAGSKS